MERPPRWKISYPALLNLLAETSISSCFGTRKQEHQLLTSEHHMIQHSELLRSISSKKYQIPQVKPARSPMSCLPILDLFHLMVKTCDWRLRIKEDLAGQASKNLRRRHSYLIRKCVELNSKMFSHGLHCPCFATCRPLFASIWIWMILTIKRLLHMIKTCSIAGKRSRHLLPKRW